MNNRSWRDIWSKKVQDSMSASSAIADKINATSIAPEWTTSSKIDTLEVANMGVGAMPPPPDLSGMPLSGMPLSGMPHHKRVYDGSYNVSPDTIMIVGMSRIRQRVQNSKLSGVLHGDYAAVTITVSADPYVMTFHEKLDVFPSEELITKLMMVGS